MLNFPENDPALDRDHDWATGHEKQPRSASYHSSGTDWFESLRNLWQWDELASEIGQENQARVAIVGLEQVGKTSLFNYLRGWQANNDPDNIAQQAARDSHLTAVVANEGWGHPYQLESYGLFILADLPAHGMLTVETSESIRLALGDPALLIYVLDATQGVRADDYRWIATLRASGKPLLVVLNKIDQLTQLDDAVAKIEQQIGMSVIPISTRTGQHIADRLLPALLDTAPKLTVPLGRELHGLRRLAAQRLTRQAAMLAGMMGAQPVPMLDLPVQAMLQVGTVLRIGAVYGYPPTGGLSREVIGTVISVFGLRYLALSLAKFIPFLGWVVSGLTSGAVTMLIGETAVRYYEGRATIPLRQLLESRYSRLPWSKQRATSPKEPADITSFRPSAPAAEESTHA